LEESQIHHNRLLNTYLEASKITEPGVWDGNNFLNSATERFFSGMNDDFNTRIAFVEVQSVVKKLNDGISKNDEIKNISAYLGWLDEFAGSILGLLPDKNILNSLSKKSDIMRNKLSLRVEELLMLRQKARDEKDWIKADEIRDELNSMNITVEDSPEGVKWKII